MERPSFEPIWKPIFDLIGTEKATAFMFMALWPGGVHTYKHRDTRRYLNIDNSGSCYRYSGDEYIKITTEEAIEHACS